MTNTLQRPGFRPLPLGAIRPQGWLARQLRIQADGLSGHLDEFWPDVQRSRWFGGDAEAWERAPYWLDGLVPLAYVLGDKRAGFDGLIKILEETNDPVVSLEALNVTLVRYPGGNFVSNYHWMDGVGPERKAQIDLAWHVLEPKTFGTNEFMSFLKQVGRQP